MKKIKYLISYMNRISTWEPRTDLIESTENERLKKSLKKCKDKIKIIER